MIKILAPLFLALSVSFPVFAIENLGPDCELSLRIDPKFSISPFIKVNLQEDQIVVRGELAPYWDDDMDERTAWSITDEFYARKILQDPWDNTYALRAGDRVFILGENGNIIVSGYYKERLIKGQVLVDGQPVETRPNRPGLYKDPELTESVISTQKLTEYFRKQYPAVLIRTMKPGEKERLVQHMAPLLMKYYHHLLSSDRFFKINEETSLEVAHFEKLEQGVFSYALNQVAPLAYDPKEGNLFRLPPELTVIPYLTEFDGTRKRSLNYGDEVVLLDLMNNVVYRERLNYFNDGKGMFSVSGKPGNTLRDLLEKVKRAVKIIVIQPVRK